MTVDADDAGRRDEGKEELLGTIEEREIEEAKGGLREREAEVAALIGRWIVLAFCFSVAGCFLFLLGSLIGAGCSPGWNPDSAFKNGLELFKTVSAVLSGPLGFVLGYYFARK